ncbi:hypothetical protein GCM10017687_20300 [Streptomyces echinatus]
MALRAERRGGGGGQGDQVRARAGHEGEVEDVFVVDRVEGAVREEREVFAVEGEGGRVVLEAERGRLDDREVGGVGDPQLGERAGAGVGPGEPGGVGREGEAGDLAVVAAVHLADLARLPLDQEQPAVVRGHRGPAAVGGHGQLQHPAELSGGQAARGRAGHGAGRGGELQGVVALGVRHPHRPLLALGAEGARQPGADTGGGGQGAGGAGAVGDPVDPAAHTDGAAARGVVGGRLAEPAGGVDRPRPQIDAGAAEPDVQAARLGALQVVQEPEFTGRAVDDPGAVAGRVPGVEAVPERGVPAQVGAVGEGGVQRAGALVVAEEGDPVTGPDRVLDVAVDLLVQPGELAGVLRAFGGPVDPQLARRTAPVALPVGGLQAHRRGQQHGGRSERQVADRAVRQGLGRSAVQRDGVRPGVPEAGPAVRAEREHPPVRQPAVHPRAAVAPVRQAFGGAALDGGDVHFRGAVPGGGPGEVSAVGRYPGPVHRHVVGADPPGPAAVERREPDVVLGDEGHQVAVQMGVTEIGGAFRGSRRGTLSHAVTLRSDRSRRSRFRITCPVRARRCG